MGKGKRQREQRAKESGTSTGQDKQDQRARKSISRTRVHSAAARRRKQTWFDIFCDGYRNPRQYQLDRNRRMAVAAKTPEDVRQVAMAMLKWADEADSDGTR